MDAVRLLAVVRTTGRACWTVRGWIDAGCRGAAALETAGARAWDDVRLALER